MPTSKFASRTMSLRSGKVREERNISKEKIESERGSKLL